MAIFNSYVTVITRRYSPYMEIMSNMGDPQVTMVIPILPVLYYNIGEWPTSSLLLLSAWNQGKTGPGENHSVMSHHHNDL